MPWISEEAVYVKSGLLSGFEYQEHKKTTQGSLLRWALKTVGLYSIYVLSCLRGLSCSVSTMMMKESKVSYLGMAIWQYYLGKHVCHHFCSKIIASVLAKSAKFVLARIYFWQRNRFCCMEFFVQFCARYLSLKFVTQNFSFFHNSKQSNAISSCIFKENVNVKLFVCLDFVNLSFQKQSSGSNSLVMKLTVQRLNEGEL